MAKVRNRDVLLLIYDDESEDAPKLRPLNEMLQQLSNPTDLHGPMPGSRDPDIEDARTWVLALTRADYARGPWLSLNHFVPLYHQSNFQGQFDEHASKLMTKTNHLVSVSQVGLEQLNEWEDDVFRESMQDQLERAENKQRFFKTCIDLGLLPKEVKCDGDCLLWSLSACASGCFLTTLTTSKDKIQSLRAETWSYVKWPGVFPWSKPVYHETGPKVNRIASFKGNFIQNEPAFKTSFSGLCVVCFFHFHLHL